MKSSSVAPISLERVSKWYGAVIGVNRVSLEVLPGITGLLGPNGAGKSTLMKLITGQLRPSLGEVRSFGRPVWRSALARRRLGFAPEVDAFHEEMSAERFVYAMARLSGLSRRLARRRSGEALERTGMAEQARKQLRACSKGMRQRIKLAQALVHQPDVIVLDEPLSGIDPAGRLELLDLFRGLRAEGRTLLISSHILHEVEAVTDRIVLLAHGRVLAAGALGEIRALMEDHPLTLRITASDRRRLAAELLRRDLVVGVAVEDGAGAALAGGDLIIQARQPERLFAALPPLVVELGIDVERLEALDASAEAVFAYLVGGSPPRGTGGWS
jgi:ABC-2 type transport system ATP-binding protein